jgi:acetylornithine deacetylase/succinyl-diaminopimelate desuccinylase-like protein
VLDNSIPGDLVEFLRIPSISTDPAHAADVRRCAEFVAGLLRRSGLEHTQVIEKAGSHPLVYADWLHAPGQPTLLLYGHYDVQPPEPLDEWLSPPFEPEQRGDNLYARGVADDKGLVLILLHAVERLMQRDGRLPVNVRVLIEGEEESGGDHIESFVAARPELLAGVDAAVVCDTEMFAPGLPTICVGLRGIVYGEIQVETAREDRHSGVYGGAIPNALQAAAEIVTALKDRDGRIQIPAFHDRVLKPSPLELAAWERLPFDEREYRDGEAKVNALTGEPGVPLFERIWARPTFEVHGIRGGFTAEGAKTVIPARAVVKVSCRLVPDQRAEEAVAQIRAAVAEAAPVGATAEFRVLSMAEPWLADPANRFIAVAARAMSSVFGNETVFTRSGGSIPIAGLFERHLGIPSVMLGFGLPDDNLHAPNEKLYLPNFHRGVTAVASYLEILALDGRPARSPH